MKGQPQSPAFGNRYWQYNYGGFAGGQRGRLKHHEICKNILHIKFIQKYAPNLKSTFVNILWQYNLTPLHVAAERNRIAVVQLLSLRGANLNSVDNVSKMKTVSFFGPFHALSKKVFVS